jgi:hypothetical protein
MKMRKRKWLGQRRKMLKKIARARRAYLRGNSITLDAWLAELQAEQD